MLFWYHHKSNWYLNFFRLIDHFIKFLSFDMWESHLNLLFNFIVSIEFQDLVSKIIWPFWTALTAHLTTTSTFQFTYFLLFTARISLSCYHLGKAILLPDLKDFLMINIFEILAVVHLFGFLTRYSCKSWYFWECFGASKFSYYWHLIKSNHFLSCLFIIIASLISKTTFLAGTTIFQSNNELKDS
jgi:hypothetical protein